VRGSRSVSGCAGRRTPARPHHVSEFGVADRLCVYLALVDENEELALSGCQPLQFGEERNDRLKPWSAAQNNVEVSVALDEIVGRRIRVALGH
jgi:hypothetical protein